MPFRNGVWYHVADVFHVVVAVSWVSWMPAKGAEEICWGATIEYLVGEFSIAMSALF